jgi:hypothetical protein
LPSILFDEYIESSPPGVCCGCVAGHHAACKVAACAEIAGTELRIKARRWSSPILLSWHCLESGFLSLVPRHLASLWGGLHLRNRAPCCKALRGAPVNRREIQYGLQDPSGVFVHLGGIPECSSTSKERQIDVTLDDRDGHQ